jgi:hypothetical protein
VGAPQIPQVKRLRQAHQLGARHVVPRHDVEKAHVWEQKRASVSAVVELGGAVRAIGGAVRAKCSALSAHERRGRQCWRS